MAAKHSRAVDQWTLIGLLLILVPITTMSHEIGGHIGACLAVGGTPTAIGAYYVDCDVPAGWLSRIVAMAGSGMDLVISICAYWAWRATKGDLVRLILWIVFVGKAMVAAGYLAFSGVTGIGDWGVVDGGGLFPVALPWLWRIAMTAIGVGAYVLVIRAAIRTLRLMLGGGPDAQSSQKQIAMTFYLVNGMIAIFVGLLNPIGFMVILTSAVASSFGGTAGLWNVAYADEVPGEPTGFAISRNWTIVVSGAIVTLLFATILGPTIWF